MVGLGVVVRDHEGAVLAVRSRVQDGFFKPLVAEAWAVGQAVYFGTELGLRQIVLEGDFKLVVDG